MSEAERDLAGPGTLQNPCDVLRGDPLEENPGAEELVTYRHHRDCHAECHPSP